MRRREVKVVFGEKHGTVKVQNWALWRRLSLPTPTPTPTPGDATALSNALPEEGPLGPDPCLDPACAPALGKRQPTGEEQRGDQQQRRAENSISGRKRSTPLADRGPAETRPAGKQVPVTCTGACGAGEQERLQRGVCVRGETTDICHPHRDSKWNTALL